MADTPFTDEDGVELEDRLKALEEVDLLIKKAERAGIDVTGRKTQTRDLREQLMKLKQAFFQPGG